MKIKKYVARNMPEALQQVREDLGDKAVILNTRQIRRNSRFNLDDEARVEVTAAFEEALSPSPSLDGMTRSQAAPLSAQRYAAQSQPEPQPRAEKQPHLEAHDRVGMQSQPKLQSSLQPHPRPQTPRTSPPVNRPQPQPQPQPEEGLQGGEVEEIVVQLRHLQETVARMEQRAPAGLILPEVLKRLGDRMRSTGLVEELTGQVIQRLFKELDGEALDDRRQVGERAAALLAESFPECKDIIKIGRRRKVIGFIGASGAGKTTALAKIAAGFAMRRKDRIVLVTTDDKRVGALDQSRAFAEIIGVPLEVAYDAGEIRAILESYETAQLVLVDTAGCGPHDRQAWEHQRHLLEEAGADEVQVVVDGLTSFDHMLDVIEASEGFPHRRLLFTKMDEVVRPGAVLSAAVRSQLPISYLVAGPEVPGGIEAGDLAKLVGKMVGTAAASPKRGQ